MKVTVNIPIVAYTTTSFDIDVPDDIDMETLKSKTNPEFCIKTAMYNLTDSALDKVYGEQPDWIVDELLIDSKDTNCKLSDFIEL